MKKFRVVISFSYLFYVGTSPVVGQEKYCEIKVDSVFAEWNNKDVPGYAVGIIQNGTLIYSKGFGLANLEYKVPLNAKSPFYIASMSKQFTAACLLILQEQGKLKLSDDIRKYLPELPDYGRTITLEHLLHHTSGMREYTSLMLYKGFNSMFEDPFTNNDVYKLLIKQDSLNFSPGDEYNYSSGGYILLTKAIEKVSGQSLRAFAHAYIFQPLGMTHTFFNDNHAEIIKNRVESYRPAGDVFERFNKNFDFYGDGGLITTIEDLAKWDNTFYAGLPAIDNFSNKMYSKGKLNNGNKIDYASGLTIINFKNNRCILHNGGMLGFSVDMLRFPEKKTTIIVMSNSWKTPATTMAFKLADIILPKTEPISKSKAKNTKGAIRVKGAIPINNQKLKSYKGHYWHTSRNHYVLMDYKNDTLFYDNTDGMRVPLQAHSADSFSLIGTDMSVTFRCGDKGDNNCEMKFMRPQANNKVNVYKRYDPTPPESIKEVEKFVGTFFSEELETHYKIFIENGKLFWQINNAEKKELFPKPTRGVWNSKRNVWTGFGQITFIIDNNGNTIGLSMGDMRVKGVYFKKL